MSIYTNYHIQIDSLLTWFPVRSIAKLKEPKIRIHTAKYNVDDLVFVGGSSVVILHGQGTHNEGNLESRGLVRAYTDIRTNENEVFSIEFTVNLGHAARNQRLIIQANTITPFLLNLRAEESEYQEINDTSVAFQGVVTAGPRRSDLLYLATRIFNTIRPKK